MSLIRFSIIILDGLVNYLDDFVATEITRKIARNWFSKGQTNFKEAEGAEELSKAKRSDALATKLPYSDFAKFK